MKRLLLVTLFVVGTSGLAEGGIFRKGNKPDPAVQIPALIEVLKSAKDEKQRAAAAAELREFDAKAYPELLAALIDALSTDASDTVRTAAAEAIGKVRPISPQGGYALENAIANDKARSVRMAAQGSMFKYRVLGFIGSKTDLPLVQSSEPPLARSDSKLRPSKTILRPTPAPAPIGNPVMPGTARPTPAVVARPTPPASPDRPQTEEPPLVEPRTRVAETPAAPPEGLTKTAPVGPNPVLTVQPKAPAPITVIPSPARTAPAKPVEGPVLPMPKPLPVDVSKPKAPEEGPTIVPPPPEK